MMTLVPLNVRLREREAIWQQRMAGGVAVAVAVGLGEWGIGRIEEGSQRDTLSLACGQCQRVLGLSVTMSEGLRGLSLS